MNTILEVMNCVTTIIFFLQTEGEVGVWYWEVDTADVLNYNGNLTEFVNDQENATLGCSVGNFASLEEAKADAFLEI